MPASDVTPQDVPIADRYAVDAAAAGALISQSESTIRRMVAAGELHRIPDCHSFLIATIELRRWAEAHLAEVA